ncbi:MAG: rhomboid family intramembrane serine protease [Planctomycetes bacterium]|nr:rhomboid family intramembrane serine protease [Planctomycetota bacterium]
MFIPIGDENPAQRIPLTNYLIIALNGLVFLLINFRSDFGEIVRQYGFTARNHEFITLFTSMFMHGDIFHIAGNMLYLWIFGDNVEDTLGVQLYIPFYLLAGLAASGLCYAMASESGVPAIGASGAIAGALGFYLVLFPWHRVKFFYWWWYRAGTLYLEAVWAIGFWFLMQLFFGWLTAGNSGMGGVAYWAHIGGFLFGFAAGIAWRLKDSRLFRGIIGAKLESAAPSAIRRVQDPNAELAALDNAGDENRFLVAFRRYNQLYGGARIDPQYHLDAADMLLQKDAYQEAVKIYSIFLLTFPNHPRVADVKYLVGTLYSQKLNQPKKGASFLRQAIASGLPADVADQTKQAVSQAETKLAQITANKAPSELKGKCMVLRRTDEPINIQVVAGALARITGQPAYDIMHRINATRGIVAQGITVDQALAVADYLRTFNIPALVLDESQTIDLPPAEVALQGKVQDDGIRLETHQGATILKWTDIYIAPAGKVPMSETVLGKEPVKKNILIRKIGYSPFGAIPLPVLDEGYSYAHKTKDEDVFFINLVDKDFKLHFLLNTKHSTVKGFKEGEEYITKRKGISLLAERLLAQLNCSYCRAGLQLLAQGNFGPDAWRELTFQSKPAFDGYTLWLTHLKKFG